MSRIIWIITTILIMSIVSIIFAKIKTKKNNNVNKNENEIRVNKLYFNIAIICSIWITAITIIACLLPTSSSDIIKYIGVGFTFLFIVFTCGYLIFFYLNYRILEFDDYFIYQNFWRIKKRIFFKDIVIDNSKLNPQIRLKKENGKTKLVFKLAGILENEDYFMKKYREWKKLPKSQREKI